MRKTITLLLFSLLCLVGMAQTQIQMPLPNYTSTYTGNVRGYWFVAPTCFTITGMEVPTDAGTGSQNIALMRFPANPPLWSTTTNAFTTLFLTQNNPATGIIPMNIQVQQGDIIGVLAQRGTANAYAPTNFSSSINGQAVTLSRLGMQNPLSTTLPGNIFTETGGSISRCWMYYDTTLNFNLTATPVSGNTYSFSNGTDTSSSMVSVWNYGDGSPLDTTNSPVHTYASSGVFNVCSYITTTCGTDTVCTTVSNCATIPVSGFGATASGLSVSFADSSVNATSYLWDFGDGNSDTTASPSHTYANGGWYTTCLITTSFCGAKDTICDSVLACLPPQAGFTATKVTSDTVMFTDNSSNAWSYAWDFGDGNTSTMASPTHAYDSSGSYQVCQMTMTPCGNDTSCQTVVICLDTLTAAFTQSMTGYTANFTNGSSGETSYAWDFGDGNTSTVASPTHTYTTNGDFVPCLTVSNDCGETRVICGDTINICLAPTASFTYVANSGTVTFTQTSTLGIISAWDFGDGNTSAQQSPVHTYLNSGTYNVCVIASSVCGADTACDSVSVTVVGLDDPLAGTRVVWYPNPFEGSANILVNGDNAPLTYQVKLIDIEGRLVRELEGKKGQALLVERKTLPAGVYFYKVEVDGKTLANGKVVAQ